MLVPVYSGRLHSVTVSLGRCYLLSTLKWEHLISAVALFGNRVESDGIGWALKTINWCKVGGLVETPGDGRDWRDVFGKPQNAQD